VSRDSQIMPECTMQCRSYEQVENPWPVTVWVLVTMLQICTKGHAALVKQDAHAWVAFPQAQESTKLHMMTSNSCSSANSASVMCCEHGMAAKYCCTVWLEACTVHNEGLPQEQRQQCAFSHALGMQSPPDVLQTASCKYLIKTQHTLMHMRILGDDVHQQVTMSEMDWGPHAVPTLSVHPCRMLG